MKVILRRKVRSTVAGCVVACATVLSVSFVQAEPVGQTAVFTGLDKITARISRLEADIGTRVQIGTLEILAQSCNKRPPEEPPETTAFVEVFNIGTTLADQLQEDEGTDTGLVTPQ